MEADNNTNITEDEMAAIKIFPLQSSPVLGEGCQLTMKTSKSNFQDIMKRL
jgi:hypothetical protein